MNHYSSLKPNSYKEYIAKLHINHCFNNFMHQPIVYLPNIYKDLRKSYLLFHSFFKRNMPKSAIFTI